MNFAKVFKAGLPGLCCALVSLPIWAQGDDAEPQVTISGAPAALADNIRASLQVAQEACDVSLPRLRRQLPQVQSDVERAANALGYYQSSIVAEFVTAEACWGLALTVTPGTRVHLDEVAIELLGTPEVRSGFSDIVDNSPVRPGAPLHHGEYEALKSSLTTRAADDGFFAARFEQAEVALDLEENLADVHLVFDPGEQFRFGPVTVQQEGSIALSDDLLQSLMQLNEGEDYSSARLAELRRRLDASQYFRLIRVSPQLGAGPDQTVPVDVDLGLRPRHLWTTGIGFSTDTGPRGQISYENRYVNRHGHRLYGDLSLSAVRSQIDGSYVIPWNDAARQNLTFAGGYSLEDNDSFRSKRFKLEAAFNNETLGGWKQRAFVEFQHDDYTVGMEKDTSVLLMPGVSVSKTRADDLINPSQGWKLFAQLRGATESVVSSATFLQAYASAKYIMSFGRGRLLSRVEVGSTWIDDTQDLPASLRYFTGGDQSIRGYDFRALGPVNEEGEVVGGRQLIVGSLEYDYRVAESWRVAVFADSGNAFDEPGNMDAYNSVGLGLRWLSPIGPVRIDLAHPLNGDESFRIHVTMGPDL